MTITITNNKPLLVLEEHHISRTPVNILGVDYFVDFIILAAIYAIISFSTV
jgi:hypothetical protein